MISNIFSRISPAVRRRLKRDIFSDFYECEITVGKHGNFLVHYNLEGENIKVTESQDGRWKIKLSCFPSQKLYIKLYMTNPLALNDLSGFISFRKYDKLGTQITQKFDKIPIGIHLEEWKWQTFEFS